MCHFPKTMGELMDHQCHSEFQFCIEAISMRGREGERAEGKEGGKGREREGRGEERGEEREERRLSISAE